MNRWEVRFETVADAKKVRGNQVGVYMVAHIDDVEWEGVNGWSDQKMMQFAEG